jgi:hypothetical protein
VDGDLIETFLELRPEVASKVRGVKKVEISV